MAFLCPSGLGRKRLTKGYASMIGRVSERDSYDFMAKLDLANLNNDHETLRIVLQAFTARAEEELSVKQGQKVHEIFREGDWTYVAADDKKMGFIPFTYCAKLGSGQGETTRPTTNHLNTVKTRTASDSRNNNVLNRDRKTSLGTNSQAESENADDSFLSTDWSYDSESEANFGTESLPGQSGDSVFLNNNFKMVNNNKTNTIIKKEDSRKRAYYATKTTSRRTSDVTNASSSRQDDGDSPEEVINDDVRVVLYNYKSCTDDEEITVRKDDIVLVLDASDNHYFLIETLDKEQGYIPSYYLGQLADEALEELCEDDDLDVPIRDKIRESTRSSDSMPARCPSYENISAIRKMDLNQNFPKHKSHSIGGRVNSSKGTRTGHANKGLINPKTNLFKMTSESNLTSSKSKFGNSNPGNISTKPPTMPTRRKRSQNSTIPNSPRSDVSSQYNASFRSNAAYNDLDDLELEDDLEEFVTTVDTVMRPQSSPPYQAYKYERERQAYYDEYFFDEPNPALKPKPDDEVINVAEILKLRQKEHRSQARPSSARKSSSSRKSKHGVSGRDLLSIRQIMANLPSTKIENGYGPSTATNQNTLHTDEISSDETEGSRSITSSRRSASERSERSQHLFNNGQKVGNLDWSFGYPRKTKYPENTNTSKEDKSSHASEEIEHSDDSDWEDIQSVFDEDGMLDLLDSTENLLDASGNLLSERNHRSRRERYRSESRSDSCRGRTLESNQSVDSNDYRDTAEDQSELKYECHEHSGETENDQKDNVIDERITEATERQREMCRRLDLLLINTDPVDMGDVHNCPTDAEATHNERQEQDRNEAIEKCSNYIQNYVIDNNVFSGSVAVDKGQDENSDEDVKDPEVSSDTETNTDIVNTICDDVQASKTEDENEHANDELEETGDEHEVHSPKIDYTDVHGITEFVVIYDYESDSPTGLSVRRGDILHIGLDGQDNKHWYWAYSPTRRKYGYVPRVYVTIAMVTVL